MKQFVFNEHNVCTNCNVIERQHGETYFYVSTAQGRNGRWYYGYGCMFLNGGVGSPCIDMSAYWNVPSFDTEQKAIRAACKDIRAYMQRNGTASHPNVPNKTIKNYGKQLVRLLDEVEHPAPKQLSLFG